LPPAAAPAAPAGPETPITEALTLLIHPATAHLGELFVGEKRAADFALECLAPQPLALVFEVSCGCQDIAIDGMPCTRTTGGVFTATVAPGSHQLRVDVTAPKAGDKGMFVRVRDGDRVQVIGLTMLAHDELRVEPEVIDLGERTLGAPIAFAASIRAHDGLPFQLSVEQVASAIQDLEVTSAAGGGYDVRGAVVATVAGRGTADVRLRSDRRFSDWVYVVVNWHVPAPDHAAR